MMKISDSLSEVGGMNQEGIFEGAFVNSWDIGNLVSDFFMFRLSSEGEGCGCSTVFEGLKRKNEEAAAVDLIDAYSNEFDRQRLLGKIMYAETDGLKVNEILKRCLLRYLKDEDDRIKSGGKKADPADFPIITVSEIETLQPLTSECKINDLQSLELLEQKVLPLETDNPDAHDSMWEILKVVHGIEATQNEMRGLREETGDEEMGEWEGRSVVMRALAWCDFISVGM